MEVVGQNNLNSNMDGALASYRALARLTNNSNWRELFNIRNDQRYIDILSKIKEGIDSLSENELTDLLLSIKRITFYTGNNNLTFADTDRIKVRVQMFVKEKKFTIRQLSSLFYSYSSLGWHSDLLSQSITNIIRENNQAITENTSLQIVQSLIFRIGYLSFTDLVLLEELVKILPNVTLTMDYNKRADLFKHLAKLEIQYMPPRFFSPMIINKLRTDLKENIEKLSEEDVISVFEAYRYLPKYYPSDLADELKQMIQVTLQHNAENLKSDFLINFLKTQVNAKARYSRSNQETINQVFTHISQRLPTDTYVQNNLNLVISLADQLNTQSQSLVQSLLSYLKTHIQVVQKGVYSIEYLLKKKIDIKDIITLFLNSEGFNKLNTSMLRRLKHSFQSSPSEIYGGDKVLEMVTSHPNFKLGSDTTLRLLSGIFSSSDVDTAFEVAHQILNDKNISEIKYSNIEDLMSACQNTSASLKVLSKDYPALKDLSGAKLTLFMDAFQKIDDPSIGQTLFLVSLLEKNSVRLNVNKLLSILVTKRNFLMEIGQKSERLASRLISLLDNNNEGKTILRMTSLLILINRYFDNGMSSSKLLQILQDTYAAMSENRRMNYAMESYILGLLQDNNVLRLDLALKYFDHQNSQSLRIHPKLITMLYNHKKVESSKRAQVEQAGKRMVEHLVSRLTDSDPRTAIDSCTQLLTMPIDMIKEHVPTILEVLRTHIGSMNSKQFLGLLSAIPKYYFMNELESYLPILKELSSMFTVFGPKLRNSEMVDAIEYYSELGVKSATLLNNILKETGRVFNYLRIPDYLILLSSFSDLGLKQNDLFDRIIQKIIPEKLNLNSTDFDGIVKALWKVGYDSDLIKSSLIDLMNKRTVSPSSFQMLIPYILSLEAKNESELLDKAFKLVADSRQRLANTERNHLAGHVAKLLRELYPEKDYAKQWEKMNDNNMTFNKYVPVRLSIINNYLEAMNVPFKLDHTLSDMQTSIFLPDQKKVLNLILLRHINYDRFTYKSSAKLNSRLLNLLATKEGLKVININVHEFYDKPTDLAKVQYIISTGVQGGTGSTYNFSNISKKEKAVEQEKESEPEAQEGRLDKKRRRGRRGRSLLL